MHAWANIQNVQPCVSRLPRSSITKEARLALSSAKRTSHSGMPCRRHVSSTASSSKYASSATVTGLVLVVGLCANGSTPQGHDIPLRHRSRTRGICRSDAAQRTHASIHPKTSSERPLPTHFFHNRNGEFRPKADISHRISYPPAMNSADRLHRWREASSQSRGLHQPATSGTRLNVRNRPSPG